MQKENFFDILIETLVGNEISNIFICFFWEPNVVLFDKSLFVERVINENAMYNLYTVIELGFLISRIVNSSASVINHTFG
jgi:hypothetical protein